MSIDISREQRFVYLCSILPMPKKYLKKAQDIFKTGLDLDEAVRIAYVHQVYSLFARNLKDHFPEAGENEAVKAMYVAANRNRFDSMKQAGELVRLYRVFTDNGLRTVPLKGVLLSKMLYDDPTYRYATDIDLLIRHDDFDRAKEILAEQGYTSNKEYVSTAKQMEVYESKFHDYDFESKDGTKLELHWRVADIKAAEILTCDNADSTVLFFGQELPTYTPEEWLIYLAYHGVHHGYMWMKWLTDFDTLARHASVDRKAAMELAAEMGLDWALRASYAMAYLVSGGDENAVSVSRLTEEMAGVLTKSNGQKDDVFIAYRSFLDTELERRGLLTDKEKTRRIDPSEKDFETFHFSDRFFFLYYVVRGPYKLYRVLKGKIFPDK